MARSVGKGREPGRVLVEGERLLSDALRAGHAPELVLVQESNVASFADVLEGVDVRICAEGLLDGVGSVKTSPGIAAVFPEPAAAEWSVVDAGQVSAASLVVCVAGVADPGNLGALARVAEAAGASALVVTPGGARPFGPKALRGSMGSLFRIPVVLPVSVVEALESLTDAGYEHFLAATRGGDSMHDCRFAPLTALWVTSETGETPDELGAAHPVTIPMFGEVESLNVTVAGALLAYAASGRILKRTVEGDRL